MSAGSLPQTLYHYTNTTGLLGILCNRELWFSDIRFLNDTKELKCAHDIVANVIKKVSQQHRATWIDAGCDSRKFDAMVGNMLVMMPGNNYDRRMTARTTPFIFSLTTNPDSLSQWRAYGDGEYCIGFDTTKLLHKISEAKLVKVVYRFEADVVGEEEVDAGRVNRFFYNHLQHINRETGGIDEEVLRDGAYEFFRPTALYDSEFLVKYKDYGFHEEEEQRMVIDIDPEIDKRVFFDNAGRYPVPRAKIRICDNPSEALDVVTCIVAGPGADQELTGTAISMLIAHMGCPNIGLSFSGIPYRVK